MFCDGKCKKGNKKCGLLTEIIMENQKDGTVKNEEMCVLQATLHSSLRVESQLTGLHAAENSTRNEVAANLEKIKKVIGTGLIGMIKSAEKRNELTEPGPTDIN
jgi:hypothetical protein